MRAIADTRPRIGRYDTHMNAARIGLGLVPATLAARVRAHGDTAHPMKEHAFDTTEVDERAFGGEADPRKVTRTIKVDMSDALRFTPADVVLKRGETVRFVVSNSGKQLHEMVLGTPAELREHAELMKKFPDMEHADANMAHVKPGAKREIVWRNALSAALGAMALAAVPAFAAGVLPTVKVFKNPSLGCCGAWVDHLKAAGFELKITVVDDTSVARKKYGLPDKSGSCHTSVVAGYVVEGHVPAADVKKLLAMKPVAVGIAVPGMPAGSPGMEMGARKDPYHVLLVDKQGRERVSSSYS